MQTSLGLSPRPLLSGNETGDVIELPRVCGMFDKPYVARYRIMPNGAKPLLLDLRRIEGKGAGQESASPVLAVNARDLDTRKERCPWCGATNGPLVICDGCGCWICTASLKGNLFKCRKSCPASGKIAGLYEGAVSGSRGETDHTPHKQLQPAPKSKGLLS